MKTYHIVLEVVSEEHYYIKAESENKAIEMLNVEPTEVYPKQDTIISIKEEK
jgi:hypothetical protein